MKEFIQHVRSFSIVTILASVVFGIAFLAFPEQSIKYISIAFGAVLILLGVIAVVQYFLNKSSSLLLTLGILVMLFGVIVCAKYKTIVSLVELLFGIFILCSGIVDLISSLQPSSRQSSGWLVTLLLSLVAIAFGVVSIIRPFSVSATLVRFIGAGLLVYAVLDLISYLRFQKIGRAVEDAVNQNSEIVDDHARIIEEEETE